mgnify:CR=1 FL=1
MTPRSTETTLARFTLAGSLFYIPIATWHSWPSELASAFYLVNLTGMLLLVWGALTSLRSRPATAPGILGAGYAWTASSGWRITTLCINSFRQDQVIDSSTGMIWLTAAVTIALTLGLAVALLLIVESQRKQYE